MSPQGARHRRGGLHRLEPRSRAARARRHRSRARQLLDRQPRATWPGSRTTSRSSRASSAATSASTTPFAGSRSSSTRARCPSVPRSVQDPLTTSAVTIEGTLNVLLAARDEDVRRVVYASSSSVYGNSGTLPRTETPAARTRSRRTRSRSSPPSGTASASTASTGSRRWRCATSTSSARGRTRTSQYAAVVPRFIAAIDDGHPVPIHGDGTQSRDFTYVANVVEANLLAGERDGVGGAVLNVATGGRRASTSSPTRSARRSASRSRRSTSRSAPATCATRGLTSARHARCSATKPPSGSRTACGSPPTACSLGP